MFCKGTLGVVFVCLLVLCPTPALLADEIWLCSGQSNMAWELAKSKDAEAEIAAAKYPKIRLFQVNPLQRDDRTTNSLCHSGVYLVPG